MDQHIPLRQLRVALQARFDCMHGPLAQRHPFLGDLPAACDDRVHPLPCHTLRPLYHRLDMHHLGSVPVQFSNPPAPLDGIILAMVGGVIQPLNRLANGIAQRHHAMQKWRPPPTTFRAVIHGDLQPCHGHRLGLIQRSPPRFKGIHEAITRFGGAAKGHRHLPALFIHDPTRHVLLVQAPVVITRVVIPSGEAAP